MAVKISLCRFHFETIVNFSAIESNCALSKASRLDYLEIEICNTHETP